MPFTRDLLCGWTLVQKLSDQRVQLTQLRLSADGSDLLCRKYTLGLDHHLIPIDSIPTSFAAVLIAAAGVGQDRQQLTGLRFCKRNGRRKARSIAYKDL